MKLYLMKCPDCGGQLEVEEGLQFFYCKYCGSKILVDRTKLQEMAHEEKMGDIKYKMNDIKYKKKRLETIEGLGMLILAGLLIGFMCLMALLESFHII